MLELGDANASRLDVAGALDLLTEPGIAGEFDDLFRHAADLGLSVGDVAAIVLARLLGGPLRKFLSRDARLGLASLEKRTSKATEGASGDGTSRRRSGACHGATGFAYAASGAHRRRCLAAARPDS
jgi:hypothetical protein